jgi:flagellar L-ring protein precursor FlgH
MKNILFLAAVLVVLCGCAELPSASKPSILARESSVRPQLQDSVPVSKGSLVPAAQVNPSAYRGLFEDRRAARVGDTLTVLLNETTRASKDGGITTSRSSANNLTGGLNGSSNIQNMAGRKTLITGTVSGNSSLGLGGSFSNSGSNSFDSKGGSSASNQFSGTITVTVLEVLPNGNLNVGGEKRLAVGNEEEVIRFGGIVSPVNLQGNTILSSQVADARIEYRGAGITDEVKSPGWLTKLLVRYSPN